MTAHEGNNYAIKPITLKAGASVSFRCKRTDRDKWKQMAKKQDMTLSEWIKYMLDLSVSDLNSADNQY